LSDSSSRRSADNRDISDGNASKAFSPRFIIANARSFPIEAGSRFIRFVITCKTRNRGSEPMALGNVVKRFALMCSSSSPDYSPELGSRRVVA
jgi:hypothetical protein